MCAGICVSFLEKWLFKFFVHFKNQVVLLLLLLLLSYSNTLGIKPFIRYMICKYLIPVCGCLFTLLIVYKTCFKREMFVYTYVHAEKNGRHTREVGLWIIEL